jgi:hypothetical protein
MNSHSIHHHFLLLAASAIRGAEDTIFQARPDDDAVGSDLH